MIVTANVNYQGSSHSIEFDTDDPIEVFRFQLYSLTGVPCENQKVMGFPGGPLRAGSWADLPLKSDKISLVLSGESEFAQPAAAAPAALAAAPPSDPAVAAPAPPPPAPFVPEDPIKCANFSGRIMSTIQQSQQYEDERLQALALSLLDWGVTERAAAAAAADGSCERVHLAKELLKWYKNSFFSWTNQPKCSACGSGTEAIGATAPTPDERRFLAGHVELYRCACGAITRFPRYNHVEKLLQTRTGRCGEWVQAFVLFCRALGFETRTAMDWSDHVWAELYVPSLGAWCHADPCEAAWHTPLMYEGGWGKKLSYVVSCSVFEAVDVTRRYTSRWGEVLQRRVEVPEGWLQRLLLQLNAQLQFQAMLPDYLAREHEARRALEAQQLQQLHPQSGSLEWRTSRGEMGGGQ